METKPSHYKAKYPIPLYIKEITLDHALKYSYTFPKNPALFKWLLSLNYLKYDKKQKLLYSEARQEILDFIEASAKGKLNINKFHFHKEYVKQAQKQGDRNTLPRIEIPRIIYTIRIIVKTALIDQKAYYLLSTDQILASKKLFESQDFISYNRRLSAFLIPQEEKFMFRLLQLVRGKAYLTVYNHVKFNSLYLKSLLWRQIYRTDIEPPKEYLQHLKSSNYSPSTIHNYCHGFMTFLYYCRMQEIDFGSISTRQVNDFVLKIASHNQHSTSTTQQMINAVLYYYKNILNKPEFKNEILRPQKEHILPKVLSREEVERILNACINLKHKAMLCLIYSCGLRAGELISLKINNINSDRKIIHILQAKGFKDRTVMLSEKMLEKLREYYKEYRPGMYLFEGQYGDQ